MELNFEGQTVVVTGATRGIGRALARGFRASGARVIGTGTDRSSVTAMQSEDGVEYWWLDLLVEESVHEFLDRMARLGELHVLINNAGINRVAPVDGIDDADWEAVLQVNLTGPMMLLRAAAKMMKAAGYGRVVNIGSIFGEVSRAGRASYTSTKYGVRGLTVTSALDLAGEGVLVNCVAPGFVRTDLTMEILSAEERAELAAQVPMGRMAEPADLVSPVLFLASDLNTYVTGQTLFVDGGFIRV